MWRHHHPHHPPGAARVTRCWVCPRPPVTPVGQPPAAWAQPGGDGGLPRLAGYAGLRGWLRVCPGFGCPWQGRGLGAGKWVGGLGQVSHEIILCVCRKSERHVNPRKRRRCGPFHLLEKRESTRERVHFNAPVAGKASFGHQGRATARPASPRKADLISSSARGVCFDMEVRGAAIK